MSRSVLLLLLLLSACASAPDRTAPEPQTSAPRAVEPATAPATVQIFRDGQERPLPELEEPPRVFAAELVEPSLLAGPDYVVRPDVRLIGTLAVFNIESDYGPLFAYGRDELLLRLEELAPLKRLSEMSRVGTAARAAQSSLQQSAEAVANVVTQPGETLEALPKAVGRTIGRTIRRTREGAKDLADRVRERNEERPVLPDNAFLGPRLSAEPDDAESWEQRGERMARSYGLSYIGYTGARRELSRQLEIDPYTRNPLIQARLDELAWAQLVGSKGTGMAVGYVLGPATAVLSRTRQINKLVWELPLADLRERNRRELRRVGLQGPRARAFMRNNAFTPTEQTEITDAFLVFGRIDGNVELLELLGRIDDPLEAQLLTESIRLAARDQRSDDPYRRIELFGVNPVWIRSSGEVVVPAPGDALYWSAEVRALFERRELPVARTVVLSGGLPSARFAAELAARGFTLREAAASNAVQ